MDNKKQKPALLCGFLNCFKLSCYIWRWVRDLKYIGLALVFRLIYAGVQNTRCTNLCTNVVFFNSLYNGKWIFSTAGTKLANKWPR